MSRKFPGAGLMGLMVAGSGFLVVAPPAQAAWSASTSGSAEAVAATMPQGNTPRASASGNSVSLAWAVNQLPGGASVEGYTITRYNATTGTAATVNPSCGGEVTTTSCVESSVPSGQWQYTVAPVQGGWHGPESAPSQTVTVS